MKTVAVLASLAVALFAGNAAAVSLTFAWGTGSDWPAGTSVELCSNGVCADGITTNQHTLDVPVQPGDTIDARIRAIPPVGYQCGDPLAACSPSGWATLAATIPIPLVGLYATKSEAATVAIARRGSTNYSTQWQNAASATITKESTVQVGDIILIGVSAYSIEGGYDAGGTTTITGFTKLGGTGIIYASYGAFGAAQGTVFYRVVDGTEGASFTISTGSGTSRYGSAVLVAFSGTSLSIETSAYTDNGSTTSLVAPSVSPAGANTMLLSFFVFSDPATFTAPSGSDGSFANSPQSTNSSAVSWDAIAASGATGTRTATLGTTRDAISYSVLLKETGGAAATGLPRRALDGPLLGALRGSVR